MQNVTVRRSGSGDEAALARLASLDSASPPRGPALIAEADSRMLAALPLGSGRAIADPFVPTVDLVGLLELRRAQMAAAQEPTGLASARSSFTRPRVTSTTYPRGSNLPSPRDRRRSFPRAGALRVRLGL